ncbi:endonuclease/Exonuclease/phosphatase [Pestalotiopsis sp. NC0098]|nr:endonuclease/Exonuclease/phosphatase [Pestalotiopsis sp. NC0098]
MAVPLRFVTFNIRYAATTLETNEKPWSQRAPYVIAQLKQIIAAAVGGGETVIGLQEVLVNQLQDILAGLGSTWAYLGVGSADGQQGGEYGPILYRPSALKVLYGTTKWLSSTPDTPSTGFGAAHRRIVTYGVFQHLRSGKRFLAANTHLDNVSDDARVREIQLIVSIMKSAASQYGNPGVVLAGDFNSEPDGSPYVALLNQKYVADLYTSLPAAQRAGYEDTFTGFNPATQPSKETRIDYIWTGPVGQSKWNLVRYEVLNNVVNNIYISDHRSVNGDVQLN